MKTNIISVKYEDKEIPKTFSGVKYYYLTSIKLNVGDIIIAPTKYGEKIARVSEINVPEYKVEHIKPVLKIITDKIDKDTYLNNTITRKVA